MYFNLPEENEEEREKKRIERENAKRKILDQMRERKIIRQEYERAEQQEAEEKQKQKEPKKELEIINLRWEHAEKEINDKRPDYVVIGDKIKLIADVNNGDGNKSLIEVHDLQIPYSIDPEQLVVDKSSKVDAGATSVEWKVSDPRSKKNADREIDLYFLVKVKDAFSENCEIPVQEVKEAFTILLEIDVDDPEAKDDELILLDNDGNEVMKVMVSEMEEVEKDLVRLEFPDIEMEKKYNLIRDYGDDDEGGVDPLFIDMTPNEILEVTKLWQ